MSANLKTVWRVGSNWGGVSILDLFLDYGVVFFGDDSEKIGNYAAAKPGDLLAISIAGELTIVAVGQVLSPFMKLGELGIPFPQKVLDNYESSVACRAKIYIIEKCEQHKATDRKRFYCMRLDPVINRLYSEHEAKQPEAGKFDIDARTVSLFKNNRRGAVFCENVRYRIPIFQRPYSWGEVQVSKLIDDVFAGFERREPKFIGTMQLSEPIPLDADGNKKAFDVIDGQQRITTFALFCHILQIKFGMFQHTDFASFLRTLVNRGEAQKDLDALFAMKSIVEICSSDDMNVYCRNAKLILEAIESQVKEDKDGKEQPIQLGPEFESYLSENILVVVIETRAGLSKTIEIFDIINTTGLDLNGSDIFKIRFYEFLTTKRGAKQDVFDAISELYKEIEVRNREMHTNIISMGEILSMLQPVIVAKYCLNRELMNYDCDRFYGQLFDSLLVLNTRTVFNREKVTDIVADKEGPLSVAGIQKMLEQRYLYNAVCNPAKGSLEDNAMNSMISCSRYGRYWFYPILFAYRFGKSAPVALFRKELVKLLITYSLTQKKSISAIHTCVQATCQQIFTPDASPEKVMGMLRDKRLEAKAACEIAIRGIEIAWNWKWKNILCRLSELLAYTPEECAVPNEKVFDSIFNAAIDIEHIQSYQDEDGNRRAKVWEEWKHILNGIGNLVILESWINRSIGNEPFDRKTDASRNPSYHTSTYRNVRQIVEQSGGTWTKEQCEARRDAEVMKLMTFLFGDA